MTKYVKNTRLLRMISPSTPDYGIFETEKEKPKRRLIHTSRQNIRAENNYVTESVSIENEERGNVRKLRPYIHKEKKRNLRAIIAEQTEIGEFHHRIREIKQRRITANISEQIDPLVESPDDYHAEAQRTNSNREILAENRLGTHGRFLNKFQKGTIEYAPSENIARQYVIKDQAKLNERWRQGLEYNAKEKEYAQDYYLSRSIKKKPETAERPLDLYRKFRAQMGGQPDLILPEYDETEMTQRPEKKSKRVTGKLWVNQY